MVAQPVQSGSCSCGAAPPLHRVTVRCDQRVGLHVLRADAGKKERVRRSTERETGRLPKPAQDSRELTRVRLPTHR